MNNKHLAYALQIFLFLPVCEEALATVLFPGTTEILTSSGFPSSADGSGMDCEVAPPPLLGTCGTDSQGKYFGVRATANFGFARGESKAYQYYEIEVDGGDGAETALHAQISGKAEFNGFVAVAGGGFVKGALTLKVVDLGPIDDVYADGGKTIHKKVLSSHEIRGVAFTGPSMEITVEGGAPYIGVGGSPGFSYKIALQTERVRDKEEFGINVLLIRGHKYWIVFESEAKAKKDAVNGLAVAQFMLGDDRVPDLIDPQQWLDGINDLLNTGVPTIAQKLSDMKEEKNAGIFSIFETPQVLGFARDFTSAQQILASSGLPTSFSEIVKTRLKKSTVDDEFLANPGAEIQELLVTLETDQVEILRHHTDLLMQIIELENTPLGQRPDFPKNK